MGTPVRIVVLDGDQTGQELLEQAIRVLDPDLLELGSSRFRPAPAVVLRTYVPVFV